MDARGASSSRTAAISTAPSSATRAALDAVPSHAVAADALRAAYTARGDVAAAVELIGRQIEIAEGPLQKARLYAEAARLSKQKLKDDDARVAAATQAKRLDPTNVDALMVLGDLAFEEERFLEAAAHYELAREPRRQARSRRRDARPRALCRLRSTRRRLDREGARARSDQLLAIAPDDAEALARVARVSFDHGDPQRAYELYRELLARFRDQLDPSRRSRSLYRLGEAARRAGYLEFAFAPLAEAADLGSRRARASGRAAKLYEAAADWENVVKMKSRRLDVAQGRRAVRVAARDRRDLCEQAATIERALRRLTSPRSKSAPTIATFSPS